MHFQNERHHEHDVDQGEGSVVSAARNLIGSAADFGKPELESCGTVGVGDLVFMPVLLLRVLRHREICGLQLQIFRAMVVCEILFPVAAAVNRD